MLWHKTLISVVMGTFWCWGTSLGAGAPTSGAGARAPAAPALATGLNTSIAS